MPKGNGMPTNQIIFLLTVNSKGFTNICFGFTLGFKEYDCMRFGLNLFSKDWNHDRKSACWEHRERKDKRQDMKLIRWIT